MLNAPTGVLRALARLHPAPSERSPRATRFHRHSVGLARGLGARLSALAHHAHLAPQPRRRPMPVAIRRSLVVRLASERMIPIVAALVVLGASVVSLQPAAAQPIGNANGAGGDVRLVVGGEVVAEDRLDPMEFSRVNGGAAMADLSGGTGGTPTESYADDGTIYKPIAVNTVVHDGKGLLQSYTVQTGDTLTGIASRYGVTMMTVWWANKLTSKDDLHVGQKLVIPPVNGLIVNVKDGDTLDTLAATYKVDPLDVVAVNQLDDPTLVIGQTLILPDAVGAPIPTPKPVVKSGGSKGGGSCNCSGPSTYGGGTMAWPVVGGGNYISQYFHYGHYGLDIAADYGSKVRAAAAGRVTFAGWKNNGGGYQVWISHGSGLYTTYNHMSSISVSTGASVGKGQQVGRVGQSGWATGPHLHFEVWKGPIWNGGTRVNPLKYL